MIIVSVAGQDVRAIGRNPDLILTYLLKEASLLLVWPSLNASCGQGDI